MPSPPRRNALEPTYRPRTNSASGSLSRSFELPPPADRNSMPVQRSAVCAASVRFRPATTPRWSSPYYWSREESLPPPREMEN